MRPDGPTVGMDQGLDGRCSTEPAGLQKDQPRPGHGGLIMYRSSTDGPLCPLVFPESLTLCLFNTTRTIMQKAGFLSCCVLALMACGKSSDVQPTGSGGSGGGGGDPMGGTPAVETVSVERQLDGSVLCKGRITSGGSLLTDNNVGFCGNFSTGAQYWDNEERTDIAADHTFTVTYPAGPGAATRYYRAFGLYASQTGGTLDVYGAETQPTEPDLGVLPCSPATNSFVLQGYTPGQGTFYLVEGPGNISDNWRVIARLYASNLQFTVEFGGFPETGHYVTRESTNLNAHHDIFVRFSMGPGTTSHYINAGQTVHVKRISATVLEITLCDATWGDGVLKKLTTTIRTGG
jgi:hypothetical protein